MHMNENDDKNIDIEVSDFKILLAVSPLLKLS